MLSQRYPALEIIVVDDGSSDETIKIVNSFIEQDSRIKLVQQTNSGVAAARNTGISHSRGEFVAPLDADDIWYPEKISCQVRQMIKSGPAVGLVYTWIATVDTQSKLIGLGTTGSVEGHVFGNLLVGNFIGCGSVPLFRRACLEGVGGYSRQFAALDAQGCEDWDLSLRISEQCPFAVVKRILVGYRQAPDSMSRDHKQMRRSHDLVLSRLKSRHPQIPRHLLRWSRSFNALYLHTTSAKKSDFSNSFSYLFKAACWNPKLVLCHDYRRWLWIRFKQVLKCWLPEFLVRILRRRKGVDNNRLHEYRLAELQLLAECKPRAQKKGSIQELRIRQGVIAKKITFPILKRSLLNPVANTEALHE